MLRVCHDSASVVLSMGCSGIMGPMSYVGHMGHFMKSGKNAYFCCRLYVTVLRVWHDSVSVVLLQSVCWEFWAKGRIWAIYVGHQINQNASFPISLGQRFYWTMLSVGHDGTLLVPPLSCS